jgi:hypothetical protein
LCVGCDPLGIVSFLLDPSRLRVSASVSSRHHNILRRSAQVGIS